MAQTWRVKGGTFQLNGRPVLFYSGELHYFRMPRKVWRDRLEEAKRLGLNAVGFYIPWIWHEPKPGQFDFTGRTHPQRDLVGFLRLLKEVGLYAFARLGPICHGELTNEGLPTWLIQQHPEVRLRTGDGAIHPHTGLISYAHPTFRAFVSRWYNHLLPLVKSQTIHRRGPIVLLQLDNEISMLNWVLRAPDHNPHVSAQYQQFLRRRYRTLDALNQSYGTAFSSLSDVPQPVGHVETEGWLRCVEWAEFYRTYYAGWYGWLARRVREAGLRLPLVANIPHCYDYNVFARAMTGLMTTSMFREFRHADPQILFGGAYQLRHVTFENLHDLLMMNEICRMISNPDMPGICAELQMGVLHDRPRLYGSDVALTLAMCYGGGLNGVNGYMLAGGESPPGIGARGRYHEWQAAIASDGRLRPHAEAVEQAGRWRRVGGEALASSTLVRDDAAFGFYAPYYMTEYLSGEQPRRLEYFRDQLFFDGLARLLFLAGFRMPFVDLQRATAERLKNIPVLIVFAMEFMDRRTQELLAAYVRRGGRLVLAPCVPTTNQRFEPEPSLLQALGIRHVRPASGSLITVGPRRRELFVEGLLWEFEAPRARVLARTSRGKPCAILTRVGRGAAMVLGFGLTHRFDYQRDLVMWLMAQIGLTPSLTAEPWDVPVLVRTSSRGHFVWALNPHEDSREVVVHATLAGQARRIPAHGTMLLEPRSCRMLPVDLALARQARLRSSSCEVVERVGEDPIQLVVRVPAGHTGTVELSLGRAWTAQVSGVASTQHRRGNLVSLALTGVSHPTDAVITLRTF